MTSQRLSQLKATAICCAFGALYVLPLYIWRPARTGKGRPRDHPDVIRARVTSISLTACLDCAVAYLFISRISRYPKAWSFMYFRWPDSSLSMLLAPLAYSGSLLSAFMAREMPSNITAFTWTWVRNFVAAPITEELVFRACCLSISRLAGSSMTHMVWITPLYFGIAHLHHAWETYVSLGRSRDALQQSALRTFFQFGYTSLFGAFASFLTFRTGSIVPAIVSHTFCNVMGMPSILWDGQLHPRHKYLLYGVHSVGIGAFCYCLYPWTASS